MAFRSTAKFPSSGAEGLASEFLNQTFLIKEGVSATGLPEVLIQGSHLRFFEDSSLPDVKDDTPMNWGADIE